MKECFNLTAAGKQLPRNPLEKPNTRVAVSKGPFLVLNLILLFNKQWQLFRTLLVLGLYITNRRQGPLTKLHLLRLTDPLAFFLVVWNVTLCKCLTLPNIPGVPPYAITQTLPPSPPANSKCPLLASLDPKIPPLTGVTTLLTT